MINPSFVKEVCNYSTRYGRDFVLSLNGNPFHRIEGDLLKHGINVYKKCFGRAKFVRFEFCNCC